MNTGILKSFYFESSPKTKFSDAQVLLAEFTGRNFSRDAAQAVWTKIVDHREALNEQLGRDAGFRVASLDFMENVYREEKSAMNNKSIANTFAMIRNVTRKYFELKSRSFGFFG